MEKCGRIICVAAASGRFEILKYLHEKGVNIRFNNDDALHEALKNGHADIAAYLFANGLNFDHWKKIVIHKDIPDYLMYKITSSRRTTKL